MFTIKSLLILKVGAVEVNRIGHTLSSEDMVQLDAELKLCVSEFLSNTAVKTNLVGATLISHTEYVGKEPKERSYTITAVTNEKFMINNKSYIPRIQKEEVNMKVEQVEFDLEVGQVKESDMKNVVEKVSASMEAKGVDLTSKEEVAAYVLANKDEVIAIAEETVEEEIPESTYAKMTREFVTSLIELDMYGDNHIHAALMVFNNRSQDAADYVTSILNIFGRDRALYAEYFRDLAGVTEFKSNAVKTAVYVTSDTVRTTGDLIEAGVTKTVQGLNKFLFQGTANIVEKTVGGRPEQLQGHNFVNDAAKRAYEKMKADRAAK